MASKAAKAPVRQSDIVITKAKTHNLKNVSLSLPRKKLIVMTGLSGSGKSSLAFDTLYAEGQRRYVESLSSYARQFLDKMNKPEVESITGIAPAVAIEQKVVVRNSRSTVGTSTEIYDYLKLLFARIGHTFSPVSGKEVRRDTTSDVANFIQSLPEGTKLHILAPLHPRADRTLEAQLDLLLQQGYTRIRQQDQTLRLDQDQRPVSGHDIFVLVDRVVNQPEDEPHNARINDSIETAFFEGHGACVIEVLEGKQAGLHPYSNRFERDGIEFEIPTEHFFSFNNPLGACKTCEGFGSVIGIDPDAVIPNKRLSIYEDAVMAWRGEKMEQWKKELIRQADKLNFPIHRPYHELTEAQKDLLWHGNNKFEGIDGFFKYVESQSYKIQYRVLLSRYRGKTICPDCKGSRIRKDAEYVKVDGYTIVDLLQMPVDEHLKAIRGLELSENDRKIASRLIKEIENRLSYLLEVGLGYLTMDRLSNTLSGGESQRIKLSTSLGSSLVGSMYILDEPSIGLHPHDTFRLIKVLRSLQGLGNTVIVVEHDEEIMRAADYIVDMGPGAGSEGGEVSFTGTYDQLLRSGNTLTAKYLNGDLEIAIPAKRRKWKNSITVKGARENNLQNIDVTFPLQCLVAVTGLSGSGKSTLISQILYPALQKLLGQYGERLGDFDELTGEVKMVKAIEFVDQNPIGKSSRSNPVTYVKAFDEIRALYADQKLAKLRNYKPSHFSFNVKGGRCETCEGEGSVTIGMQFMADVQLTCETCKGQRYKAEVLEIQYREKSISQILGLTVDDAVTFFAGDKKNRTAVKITEKLLPLQKVGLGYVQLGQASSTLSGGEAQRTKLAAFLSKGTNEPHTLFIFDEPTTGLHFHDVAKLLTSINELLDRGHSVIVIEHNLDVIKMADWLVDLGPGGGKHGGKLLHAGTPEGLLEVPESLTGKYLKAKF